MVSLILDSAVIATVRTSAHAFKSSINRAEKEGAQTVSSPKKIFHIVSKASWAAAQQVGEYRGDTLLSEGFIHCSQINQVLFVANARFKGREDLVLLSIDETRVTPEVKYEEGEVGVLFPHIYGPLNIDAVVGTNELLPDHDGLFKLPEGVD